MIRQGSLVSADVAWPEAREATQCLVTWEVAGGGLMGNLLTDSASVELSLWPETKYRVQVTCKNKVSESVTVCGLVFSCLLLGPLINHHIVSELGWDLGWIVIRGQRRG